MGCSCDWDRTRFTLDDVCARAVRQTFFDFFQKGLIYRGKRLVNWDTFLQTAVSDDEVENKTVKGHFWHYRYPVINPQPGEPEFVTIATTRPETMLGDTAVAVHPNPAAALAKAEQELIEKFDDAPAKERGDIQKQIDIVRDRQETMLPHLEKLRDMAIAGRKLMLPLVNREIPLIADDWAKPELGSGCVKITPAHDPNDYEVWQRHKAIGAINILNTDGTLNENAGKYKGLTIPVARKQVVADLIVRGLLNEDDIEDREIELPHSDRSKTPIEPYLADQWFLRMRDYDDGRPGLSQIAMDAVIDGRVKVTPERYAKGYLDWLSEKRDWPIGRQLWWGHQIPVWTRKFSGKDERDRGEGDGAEDLQTRFRKEGRPASCVLARVGSRNIQRLRISLHSRRQHRPSKTNRSGGFHSRRRSPRHLVQQCPLAAQHAGLAGEDGGAGPLVSDERVVDGPRHHHVVGRPHGFDGPQQHGRRSVPPGLHSPDDFGRRRRADVEVEGERHRPARHHGEVRRRRDALRPRAARDRDARHSHAGAVRVPALREVGRSNEEEPPIAAH